MDDQLNMAFSSFQQLFQKPSVLTHSLTLMHHFETVPNSKKLQMITEMWLLKDFKIQIAANIVKKGEITRFEQFYFFPHKFSYSFFLPCVEMSIQYNLY